MTVQSRGYNLSDYVFQHEKEMFIVRLGGILTADASAIPVIEIVGFIDGRKSSSLIVPSLTLTSEDELLQFCRTQPELVAKLLKEIILDALLLEVKKSIGPVPSIKI